MADTDPFVKRMLARSEARRAMLAAKLAEDGTGNKKSLDKENIPKPHVGLALSSDCKHKGNKSEDTTVPLNERSTTAQQDQNQGLNPPPPAPPMPSSPIKSSLNASPSKSCNYPSIAKSPNKTDAPSSGQRPMSGSCLQPQPVQTSAASPPSASGRGFKALARRQREMQAWEDDYAYHSSGSGSKVSSKPSSTNPSMHGPTNCTSAAAPAATNSSVEFSRSASSYTASSCVVEPTPCCESLPSEGRSMHADTSKTSSAQSNTAEKTSPGTPTYHYGEAPVLSPEKEQAIELALHKPRLASTDLDQALAASNKVLPTSGPVRPNRDMSPTSKMFWDRKLIDSLEAQGYTPESKSRLVYEFKKEYDKREQQPGAATPAPPSTGRACRPVSAGDHSDPCSSVQDPSRGLSGHSSAPKILSCVLKTTPNSDVAEASTRSNQMRATSPKLVERLCSRWEEQIRESSPDRQHVRARSCSPKKAVTASSTATSPQKAQVFGPNGIPSSGRQFQPQTAARGRSVSPVKNASAAADPPASAVSSAASGAAGRGRSPTKQPASSGAGGREIVKGVCPMPETVPLLDAPHQSSVKERAAAFAVAMGAPAEAVAKKDPAELSVQGRRQIFEKRGEDALLPKAPFGQPVPAKMLQSCGPAPAYKKAPASVHHSVPAMPSSARHAAPSGGSTVSRYRDALEVRASTAVETAVTSDDAWQQQKRREMEALRNRFSKADAPQIEDHEHSDSEYPESEDSYCASTEPLSPGPPKPPRTYAEELPPYTDDCMPPPPHDWQSHNEKSFEPCVKPGCLYPGLSDFESLSDKENFPDESSCSSEATVDATCISVDSLGTKIQKIAQSNRDNQRIMTTLPENAEEMDETEACSDTSAALDEAFSDDSASHVTPPKRHREEQGDAVQGHNQYKTPRISASPSKPDSGSQTPLVHTVSMYRKQRQAEMSCTPVRQVIHRPAQREVCSPASPAPESPSVAASAKIRVLYEQESNELRIMQQACVAACVAEQRLELRGDTHHVEAEKLLLVATHRRMALLAEIQRVKTEAAMLSMNCDDDSDTTQGSVHISNITLPLNQDFLKRGINEGNHHVLVLVKQRDVVLATDVQSTPSCVINGVISFPNNVALENLKPDFAIVVEVYGFKMTSPVTTPHSNLKKDQSRLKLTPLKRLQQHQRNDRGSPISSGTSSSSSRPSAFHLLGFTNLTIASLDRGAWALEKVPSVSPFSGHLLMKVQVSMQGGISFRGFLTVFQDVGGLGAWTRRWAVLDGPSLKFWSYPDQENKQDCVQFVPLKLVSTRRVELVSRDVCARPHTMLMTTIRPTEAGDTNSLVTEIAANTTITKLLLSADSSEERVEWCRKFNVALANIRAWDPQATRPDHYRV